MDSIQYISVRGVNPKVGKLQHENVVWRRKECGYFSSKIVPPPNSCGSAFAIRGRDIGNKTESFGKPEDFGQAARFRLSRD